VVSPNGDAYADELGVSYVLTARASVTASVIDSRGVWLTTIFSEQRQSARRISFVWPPIDLADGGYTLVISARAGDGRTIAATAAFAIDRTLGFVWLDTPLLTPDGDGVGDTLGISFVLSAPASVTVEILQGGVSIAVVFQGLLEAGPVSARWDGTTSGGALASGGYEVRVSATDQIATVTQTAAFQVSTAAGSAFG
jgi:hypothetical protein